MTRPANYVRPVLLSLQVLMDACIDSFPVSLNRILKHYGIRLMNYEDYCAYNECGIETCFDLFGRDGATIENNGRFLIVYNRRQSPKNRIRFTPAHELGHIFLVHHEELGMSVLRRFGVEKNLYNVMEDEANCFARNLLCPALAVQTVLRSHGFVACEYDDSQYRNVWLRVPSAASIPNLSQNLTDYFLVRQSFMVTDSAAKTRCHFLRQDIRSTSMTLADDVLTKIRFTAQWRCMECGALKLHDTEYCYYCGARNRFSLIPMEAPATKPRFLKYNGLRYSFCPVCGNEDLAQDSDYCHICGSATANPCQNSAAHLNPPGCRYCLTCGAPTVYNEDNGAPLWKYAEIIGGQSPVKYGPDILCKKIQNGSGFDYKVLKCPACLNEDIENDAEYCIMCGTNLSNICDGWDEYERHSNPPNARFCRYCGTPTAFSRLTIFPPYKEALRRIAEKNALRIELAEMDIDEDLFVAGWEDTEQE